MKSKSIDEKLVPILKTRFTDFGKNDVFFITRNQFPVTPANAVTVHKSQGSTYNQICVDLTNSTNVETNMVYVAYSRVTSLKGL